VSGLGLAVVGTDTGVGKTVVCALLLAKYGRRAETDSFARDARDRRGPKKKAERPASGPRLAYWKPVSTGVERDRDALFIRTRAGDLADVIEEEYRFNPPVSPHLAARLVGEEIDLGRIREAWERHSSARDRALVVEGIGGLLVPLNEQGDLLADLLALLGLPAVLVARTTLGTINHTLLALEAMRKRKIVVAGVVMDGPRSPENLEAIERFGAVKVLSEVPPLVGGGNPSRAAIISAADAFDPRGELGLWLSGQAGGSAEEGDGSSEEPPAREEPEGAGDGPDAG
jgi:dethiobiotin synthetase